MRERGQACAAYPLQRRVTRDLLPQPVDISSIFAKQQRRKASLDAARDQLVAGQMRVRAGKAIARHAIFSFNLRADHAPVRNRMRAVGDLPARHRDMQDERLD